MSDSICILPRLEGVGGPASFRARLSAGLERRGIRAHSNPAEPGCRAVLVIAGTRRLNDLLQARQRGVRIVQRLDGMNWLHRLRWTGLRHYLRSETNNLLLAFIRRRLADRIVYQSAFTRDWWQTVRGGVNAPGTVIYNGVDLGEYTPDGPTNAPRDACASW
ncbi:MAG TPA: glycosyltransferase [Anaerolinea sp.]|nr:glycosyltransferase [Anaerolinea sp.]